MSPSPSEVPASQSPTQQPTVLPSTNLVEQQQKGFLGTYLPNEISYLAIAVVIIAALIGLTFFFKKHYGIVRKN